MSPRSTRKSSKPTARSGGRRSATPPRAAAGPKPIAPPADGSRHKVWIAMGSDSDMPVMEEAAKTLKSFGIPYEMMITSAHRTPDQTADRARALEADGFGVAIVGAGHAAHLAGVVAAHTTIPVIGVPLPSSALQGFDSLLSTVQMPSGIPVATVALGKSGAQNAAILAAQILATAYPALRQRLHRHKERLIEKVLEKNKALADTARS